MKKILFVTGTRADFSKIKSLMHKVQDSKEFELFIFATGMHMSKNFGLTADEIKKAGFRNIYHFINHDRYYSMDKALASTIDGFSKYVAELEPDLIVIHGDRIEPLAAASVGILNNILVAHIEGGEISGTVDDSLRHAISKLSHIHLVNDEVAKRRLIQLGEDEDSIFIIGSPDLDILENNRVSLKEAKAYYEIPFRRYAIAIFHPVVTEFESIKEQARQFALALRESKKNYIIIYPNNDLGFEFILQAYEPLKKLKEFRLFPSLRFEYFMTLLQNADFIIGNSSCILKEAVFLNVAGINVGTRQRGRAGCKDVANVPSKKREILKAIDSIQPRAKNTKKYRPRAKSDESFMEILQNGEIFKINKQKIFRDRM